jgi:aldose 1-epimerase
MLALTMASPTSGRARKETWGKTAEGVPVDLYTLGNAQLTVRITNFGARIVSVVTPDRSGHRANVVLGFEDIQGYESAGSTHIGAVVGRYGNRIAREEFSNDSDTCDVPLNDGSNALHTAPVEFNRLVWSGKQVPNGIELTLTSPCGDLGCPGSLTTHVEYTLSGDTLRLTYSATTDTRTVINLTNHTYFNLASEGSGSVLKQKLILPASSYTPVDKDLMPTGVLAPVAGTPFDFRSPTAIGDRIHADDPQLTIARGYDHNFVLDGKGFRIAARVWDPVSGRSLTVRTTEPGVQFYSGNFLNGKLIGIGGRPYERHAGFCLETQHYPNSSNQPSFPSTILRPGQEFYSVTTFKFSVQR